MPKPAWFAPPNVIEGSVSLHVVFTLSALLLLQYPQSSAIAQNYPTKPIRILAPEIGGASDISARLIAHVLSGSLGQQVIVENRGTIGPEIAAKAPPDGYTLISYGSPLWLTSFLRSNVAWEVKDFLPITLTASSPNLLVVHPSLPARSVKELIALAKARPGAVNFSAGSIGAPSHLTGELFNAMAGVKIVRVPYRGNGAALNAVMAGEVALMFASAGSIMPHLNAGRLRALAVTSAKLSPLVPGLPTVAVSGVPGFESVTVIGIFAPTRTPAALLKRLNEEIVKAITSPEIKAKFFSIGVEPGGSSPEQFEAFVNADMAKWGKVIRDAGIRE